MKTELKKVEYPTDPPCLMMDPFDRLVLATKNTYADDKSKFFVTILEEGGNTETYESDLKDYKPLPKGTQVTITNG